MKVINVRGLEKTDRTETVNNIIEELRRRGHTVGTIKETHYNIMLDNDLDIDRLLDVYTHDYVVIEGQCEANCPGIVTGSTCKELHEQIDPLTIALSGAVSNEIGEYQGLPAINSTIDISHLVDIIEEKTPDRMPNYSKECCTSCGTDCRGLTERILKGTGNISQCILKGQNVCVFIDGEELPMVPFVKDIVRSVSTSVIKELDGYRENCEIIIKITG